MIRIAGKRTGVEILGTESDAFVPTNGIPNGALSNLTSLGFQVLPAVGMLINPDLWVHDLLSGTGQPLGQLVLCNPDTSGLYDPLKNSQSAALLPNVYAGMTPNTELWAWQSDSWPTEFVLRGVEYPRPLMTSPSIRVSYPMDVFSNGPLQPLFEETSSQDFDRWEIWTDLEPTRPVGGMTRRRADGAQQWWALPEFLHGALIPPGSTGVWEFRAPGAPISGDDYVQLSTGLLVATNV